MTVDYTRPYNPLPPAAPPPPPPKSSGCLKGLLIGCAIVALIAVVGVAGLVFFVFSVIKSADVYKEALQRVRSSPAVVSAVGTPIEPGWWVRGTMSVNNNRGSADFTFPIEGRNGDASVHVVATRSQTVWHYDDLVVTPDDHTKPPIDLLK